jgi:GNAT superfamily N-acetyltransferase
MNNIRICRDDDRAAIVAIINAAAEAYRGVIPADQWHEPYMPRGGLDSEIATGVTFWGYQEDGALVGVIGLQSVRDVDLIRHAYVLRDRQRCGVGGALLSHLRRLSTRRMLVGTWDAADWAIRFYRQHGFELVPPVRKSMLLKTYWTISDRQIEASAVPANPPGARVHVAWSAPVPVRRRPDRAATRCSTPNSRRDAPSPLQTRLLQQYRPCADSCGAANIALNDPVPTRPRR